MTPQIDVAKLAAPAYEGLFAVTHTLEAGELPKALKHLVDLRVSQINHCDFCIDLHQRWATKDGETAERLAAAAEWRQSTLFSDAEKAALAWAEALTEHDKTHLSKLQDALLGHFTPTGIAQLTMVVAVINAWNRVGIAGHISPVS